MTKSTPNQSEYTRLLLIQAGMNVSEFGRYSKEWWWNQYEIKLPEPLKNRTLIQMSRLLTCPYYIKQLNLVYLLGEEESVLLALHADNLQQYLDNLQL